MMKPPIAKVIPYFVTLSMLVALNPVGAQTTAKTALEVFRAAKGAAALKNVVVVRGVKGISQPHVWEVIALDVKSGGTIGYIVDAKRILKTGRVKKSIGGAPIELHRLNLDSTQAFRIADAEARRVKVGFDSIDYQLRAVPFGYAPVWLVRLRDAAGREAGVVEISGVNGAITGGRWGGKRVPNGQTTVAAAPQRRMQAEPEIEESAGEMREENRPMVDDSNFPQARSTDGRANAGTPSKTGFAKIGSAFAEFFSGAPELKASGKQRWSPNHGAASRGH